MVLLVRLRVRERIGCACTKTSKKRMARLRSGQFRGLIGSNFRCAFDEDAAIVVFRRCGSIVAILFIVGGLVATESISRRTLDTQVLGLKRCHLGPNFRSRSDVVLLLVFACCVPPLFQASYIVPQTTSLDAEKLKICSQAVKKYTRRDRKLGTRHIPTLDAQE